MAGLFGESKEVSEAKRKVLRQYAEEAPLAFFQELNKALNKRGFMLVIEEIED